MPFINDMLDANRALAQPEAASANTIARPQRQNQPMVSRFRFEPDKVMAFLRRRIVGQQHVLADIEQMLHVVKADIADPQRPLYVALLAGPTGVGKSSTVALLSEAITGRKDGLCRIDMNTLAQEHYAAAITGHRPAMSAARKATPSSTSRPHKAVSVHPALSCSMKLKRQVRR